MKRVKGSQQACTRPLLSVWPETPVARMRLAALAAALSAGSAGVSAQTGATDADLCLR